MCSKPDPTEYYRDLSRLVESLREEAADIIVRPASNPGPGIVQFIYHDPAPAGDYGWAGARAYYGLLETA